MIEGITNADAIPVLERMIQFAGGRHRLIAHNVANMDTPDYRPVDVSVEGFQKRLGEAIDDQRRSRESGIGIGAWRDGRGGSNGHGGLPMQDSNEVTIDGDRMVLHPSPIGDNILFHDGNDADPERLMQALVENFMAFRTASDLLRSRFAIINTAIRERL